MQFRADHRPQQHRQELVARAITTPAAQIMPFVFFSPPSPGCSRANSSATRKAPSPARKANGKAASNGRTPVPCFSTKSARSTRTSKRNCCACCRKANSNASAATRPCASIRASSRRRTGTWMRPSRPAHSAKISTTASTCTRSASNPCAPGPTTSPHLSHLLKMRLRVGQGNHNRTTS